MTTGTPGRRRWIWMAGALATAVLGAAAVVLALQRVEPPDMAAVRGALARQQWQEVEARLARWHRAHPEDGDAGMMLGLARLEAGRLDDGIAALERVPEAHPAWGQAQALIGEAELQRHRAAEAERRFLGALGRDPK